MSCRFCADAPFFCEVTSQIAANHVLNGVRVRCKIVPAVTEVLRPQPAHFQCRVDVRQALSPPHTGHRKPSGQRKRARYSAQDASWGNHARNS
jgi:hypothetical protein